MGGKRNSTSISGKTAARSFAASIGAILFSAALALAQEGNKPAQPSPEASGFLGAVSRWLDEHTSWFGSGLRGARSGVENFGHEAGLAAKSTVEGAKDAAGAVTRFPFTRVVNGYAPCAIAPNGAPDCVAAANAICQGKGFGSGKSVDMTTAEICPAKVYLAGRNSGPECHTETFVSRALCQ